jgi:hypothetical protein
VARLALQDLRRDVVGSAADGFAALVGVAQRGGQTKVTNLDAHVAVDKQVAQLQIAVNNEVSVQVLQRLHYLSEIVASLWFGQLLSPFNQLRHRLANRK